MKNLVRYFILSVLVSFAAFAQSTPDEGFRTLQIDAGKVVGEIHSFQGLNGQPTPVMAGLPNLVQQYKDLRVNQVRTHDFMGPTEIDSKFEFKNGNLTWLIPDAAQRAGVVKAGNASIIFPDPNADPEKAESYNFGPTDEVLGAIRGSGAEIYYRVGRSWGANINPPADFDKYANVVKHIAMHYNQGWADGFYFNIRYWEFWNEPEGFWSGTPEQFYSLYEKTALALSPLIPPSKSVAMLVRCRSTTDRTAKAFSTTAPHTKCLWISTPGTPTPIIPPIPMTPFALPRKSARSWLRMDFPRQRAFSLNGI